VEKISRHDLMSLENYHERRSEFRRSVMAHKANRQIAIGDHATLYFEDRLTIQYQVQEMLRVERIFQTEAIEEELAAYNPLIPDGSNWKATFMLEYEDPQERASALERLVGIEDRIWATIGSNARVWAIADEDLDRSRDTKTSAVHFLRFEFDEAMVLNAHEGTAIAFGIDHPHYTYNTDSLPGASRDALAADFSPS
jgi:hypothetical protein